MNLGSHYFENYRLLTLLTFKGNKLMSVANKNKPVILTGDRTTGELHLGHFAGSLQNRVSLQNSHKQYVLLADNQALTDNADNIEKVRNSVLEIAADYLSVGIDPAKTTICVQSHLPALAELTLLYLNFVSVARLERNPTIKDEIQTRNFGRDIPAGFLVYPAAQAADITAFKATVVPVGEDQIPIIEQTNEIVRRINKAAKCKVLLEASPLLSRVTRLPGSNGAAKMSKSAGNSLKLSASTSEISAFVHSMYTDPTHLRVDDPGQVKGNVVFTYLDAFAQDEAEVKRLKNHYQQGGLGDMVLKRYLEDILQDLLAPIRAKRERLIKEPAYIMSIIKAGTEKAQELTQNTHDELSKALGLFRMNI